MTGERRSAPPGVTPRDEEPTQADDRVSERPMRSGPPAPVGTWTTEVSSADSERPTDVDFDTGRDSDKTLPFGGPDLPTGKNMSGGAPVRSPAPPPAPVVDLSGKPSGGASAHAPVDPAPVDPAPEIVVEIGAAADDEPRGPAMTEPDPIGAVAAATTAESLQSTSSEERELAGDDPKIEAQYFGMTDVGLVREHNEDNFLVADVAEGRRGLDDLDEGATLASSQVHGRGAIFAVCDGMGGAAAGEVASQMAVDTIYEFFVHLKQPKDRDHFARRIVASVEEAGNRIFSAAKMDRSRRGMGTTATVAGLIDKVLFVGQVGDSRAYVLREGKLTQITKDQSLVNQLIEAGQLTEDEAEAFEHSNIILQALGTTEEVTVDLTFLELRQGDRLMMCSDGLSGLVHPEMMTDVLSSTPSLAEACSKLIEMANVGGGHDNITVVCADFGGAGLADPMADDQVLYQQYPLPTGLPDDREALPVREPRMKTGGPKPGADVKRDPNGRRDDPDTAPATSRGSRAVAVFMVAGLLLVVLLVAAAFAFFAARGDDPRAPSDVSVQSGLAVEEQVPLPETVGVSIETDIEGELWIDGELFGPMSPEEQLIVRLEPGAYRVEARHEGAVLAGEVVTVELGDAPTLTLRMPLGADGSEADDAAPIDEVSPDDAEGPGQSAEEARVEGRRTQERSERETRAATARNRDDAATDEAIEERRRLLREARERERVRRRVQTSAEELPDNPFD